jgi:lipopolysaccharide transport system ATP-binding protein
VSDVAIRVENLSKQYKIGKRQSYRTLRDTVADAVKATFRRASGRKPDETDVLNDTIWALLDVSCEIRNGEVVGIIGRNGSGKSTFLKILSRITEPTGGSVEIRGRVGSLLEVGTGFHPELSGRENIYLNGSILGMKRSEIDRKFDEIVAFAEVERFIDTPVKHYSSGMYTRLAFAVAAHLEPELLLVDEVLAVGDARFQKKCLNKMQDIGQEGRTVLFVSHNMPAVTRLCERVILLDEGRLLRDGPAHEVTSAYLTSGLGTTAAREWRNPAKAPAGDVARLCAVRVRTEYGQISEVMDIRQPVRVEMEYDVLRSGYVLSPYFDFYTEAGVHAFSAVDLDPAWGRRSRPTGRYVSTAWIPGNLLSEGTLFVGVGLATLAPNVHQWSIRDAVAFQVVDSHDGDSARGGWTDSFGGAVRPLLKWSTHFTPDECEAVATATEETKR